MLDAVNAALTAVNLLPNLKLGACHPLAPALRKLHPLQHDAADADRAADDSPGAARPPGVLGLPHRGSRERVGRGEFAERFNYGVRRKWEPFLFDQFSMDVSDALCVAGERLNPVSIAVVVPKGKEPPRSRSVVNKLANVDKRK